VNNEHSYSLGFRNKKSPANANGNAQQRCMFESAVKQSKWWYVCKSHHRPDSDHAKCYNGAGRLLDRVNTLLVTSALGNEVQRI